MVISMEDKHWREYCEKRKHLLEKEIERLKDKIAYLQEEIRFYERQLERRSERID